MNKKLISIIIPFIYVLIVTGCDPGAKSRSQGRAPLAAYEIDYKADTHDLGIKSIDVTPPKAGISTSGLAYITQTGNTIFDGAVITASVYITNTDTSDWTGVQMQAYTLSSGSATVCDADLGTGWFTDTPVNGAWGWIFTSGTSGSEFTIPANGGQSADKVIGFNATTDFAALVYIYADVPVITVISPATALTGDTVTISGYNFSTTEGSVTFNGITATVQSWTDTSITATVPDNATLGNIVVDSGDPYTAYSNPSLFTPYRVFSDDPSFVAPIGITTDTTGNLYIAEFINNAILESYPSGTISTYSSDPLLNNPADVAIGPDNALYVANYSGNNIITVSMAAPASVFASVGLNPVALAFSSEGQAWPLFTANSGDGTISSIASDGTVTQFASGFVSPNAIAVDNPGNVYVGDCNAGIGTIDRINAAGTVTTTIISGLVCPGTIKFDTSGNMYIFDSGTATIYKYNQNIACGSKMSVFAQDISTNGDGGFVFSPDYSILYITQDSPIIGIIAVPLK